MKIIINLEEDQSAPVQKILQGLKEAGLIQSFQTGKTDMVGSLYRVSPLPSSAPQIEQSPADIAERYRDLVD